MEIYDLLGDKEREELMITHCYQMSTINSKQDLKAALSIMEEILIKIENDFFRCGGSGYAK